ncbi:MAG TPA: hypothetical protein VKR58_10190 [Aquella sp.]|nr:hypothetical protein [Aquella sp.]
MSLTDKAASSTEDGDSLLSTYTQETMNAETERLELENVNNLIFIMVNMQN